MHGHNIKCIIYICECAVEEGDSEFLIKYVSEIWEEWKKVKCKWKTGGVWAQLLFSSLSVSSDCFLHATETSNKLTSLQQRGGMREINYFRTLTNTTTTTTITTTTVPTVLSLSPRYIDIGNTSYQPIEKTLGNPLGNLRGVHTPDFSLLPSNNQQGDILSALGISGLNGCFSFIFTKTHPDAALWNTFVDELSSITQIDTLDSRD